jgi:hypothetical protein
MGILFHFRFIEKFAGLLRIRFSGNSKKLGGSGSSGRTTGFANRNEAEGSLV